MLLQMPSQSHYLSHPLSTQKTVQILTSLSIFFYTIFVLSHIYSENPEGRRDPSNHRLYEHGIGYISDTARNRTHNLFCSTKCTPIPLGNSDGHSDIPSKTLHNTSLSPTYALSSPDYIHESYIKNYEIISVGAD